MKECNQIKESSKNSRGGVKWNSQNQETNTSVIREKDWYKEKIVDMVNQINDEKFLNQIRIILKRHIEKRGG